MIAMNTKKNFPLAVSFALVLGSFSNTFAADSEACFILAVHHSAGACRAPAVSRASSGWNGGGQGLLERNIDDRDTGTQPDAPR